MKLYIKSSNSLNLLVDELISDIRNPADGAATTNDIFRPVYIVTQTDGMQSWLKTRIAEKTGIAANLVFLKPNELVNKIYFWSGGEYENNLSQIDVQWLIFDELKNKAIHEKYPALAGYYKQNGTDDQVKRISLSQQIADLFDQYQVYRADMLKKWVNGITTTTAPEEKWQKDIWCRIKEKAGKSFPDKSRIKDSIIQNLSHPVHQDRLAAKIPAIYFFGTSLVTTFHFEILQAIAQQIPVNLYLPNPAPHIYWYEDKSKKALFLQRRKGEHFNEGPETNPLLVNWGKLVQNTFQLFFRSDEVINMYQELPLSPAGGTLLSSVQDLIYNNTICEAKERFDDSLIEDKSIVIRSCFSEAREVETLYNYLVKLIDENPGRYSPRDIVVHVTNINRYSSYIRAVFNNAPYPLCYTIADESFTESDSISRALYEILTMTERDFTSENIVRLLNYSPVRKHFRISDSEVIRDAVATANIRHGIEGEREDESVLVSWNYGLKRIMYGICMITEDEYIEDGESFYPLNLLESADANEVIRFVHMVDLLIDLIKERDGNRPVAVWIDYVHEVLRQLIFDEEEKNNEEYRQLSEHLNNMSVAEELFNEEISYQVFLKQFLPGLSEMGMSYMFSRGGITFCSLIPMRSIPFKIVAMLGLNFDKFPRKPVITGFDLMHKFPMPGDRNIKVNDKHLFLETVMSAGEKLYLSYIGQRIKDNAKLPPTILVDELISFIESSAQSPDKVRAELIREEPLHGFSNQYGNKPGYYNYLLRQAETVQLDREESTEQKPERKTIDLNDIYRFLSGSIQWYYKNVTGIYYDEEPVALPETEIFDLDTLGEWQLKNELLEVNDEDMNRFIESQKKTGLIPLKNSGTYVVEEAVEASEIVKQHFDEETKGLTSSVENIEIEIDDYTFTATIHFVYGDKALVPCFSKNAQKYLLKTWLSMLALRAAGRNHTVIFVGAEKITAEPVSQNEAVNHLRELIALTGKGKTGLIPFDINWFAFTKPPKDDHAISKVINNLADPQPQQNREPDKYAQLAIHDGLPENLLELYESAASVVMPAIINAFNLDR